MQEPKSRIASRQLTFHLRILPISVLPWFSTCKVFCQLSDVLLQLVLMAASHNGWW